MISRREFIGKSGAIAAGTAGLVTLARSASAGHFDTQPDHVTISYDQSRLHAYRPLFQIQPEDREKLLGLYGWIATSPEYETDVFVYWMSYTHQEAPWWGPNTGHYGDHEPVAVEADSETGDVKRVRASIYHWIKGEVTGSTASLGGDNDKNPRLRVVNPHHQYTVAGSDASLSKFEVKNLENRYQSWLDNGLEDSLVDGACVNPWMMRNEEDWWRPGAFGFPSTEQRQANFARRVGFGVAGSLETE